MSPTSEVKGVPVVTITDAEHGWHGKHQKAEADIPRPRQRTYGQKAYAAASLKRPAAKHVDLDDDNDDTEPLAATLPPKKKATMGPSLDEVSAGDDMQCTLFDRGCPCRV